MDIVTASLLLGSLIFDGLVYFFVKYLTIYGEDEYEGMIGGVRLVPVQHAAEPQSEPNDGGAAEPLLQQPTAASDVLSTGDQSTVEYASIVSPEPRPVSPLQPPPSQVTYAEILRTAPAVVAERQVASPSPTPASPEPSDNMSPLSARSMGTSSTSTGASYILPTGPPERPTGFKERLAREPLPGLVGTDQRALSPETDF